MITLRSSSDREPVASYIGRGTRVLELDTVSSMANLIGLLQRKAAVTPP